MELILVRHARTDMNEQKRYVGWTDTPLNAMGERQAACLVAALHDRPIGRIIASDLQRAVQTITPLATVLGLPIEQDARLREINFGDWECQTYAEIMAQSPAVARAYFDNLEATGAPNGEPFSALVARTKAVLAEIVVADAPTTVVVGHGGSLRLLLCHLLSVPVALHWQFKVKHGTITELDVYDSGAILRKFSDSPTLPEGEE